MKLILENWRGYLREEEEPPRQPGRLAKSLGDIGTFISKNWDQMDDALRKDYCEKKFPEATGEEGDIQTFGQLVALLNCTVEYSNRKKVLTRLTNYIPTIAAARAIFNASSTVNDFILKMYQVPDNERPVGNLGKLDMDDAVAAIVDDKIEALFVKDLINLINTEENLTDPIPDNWDITDALKLFLAQKYDARTITGYGEEG